MKSTEINLVNPKVRKHKRVAVYVIPEDYKQLKSMLALAGKNFSAWVRESMRTFLES